MTVTGTAMSTSAITRTDAAIRRPPEFGAESAAELATLGLIRRPVTDAQTAGYHAENAGFYRDPAGYHRGPSRSVSYRFPTQPVFCGLNALGVGYRATVLEGRLQPKWHHAGRSAAITHAVRVDNPHPRADTPRKSLCLAGLGSRPAPKTARK